MNGYPFWHPAQDRAQIWRTLVGTLLVLAIWLALTMGIVHAGAWLLGEPVWIVAQGGTWPAAAVFFASFLGFHAGLGLVAPLLHRRSYLSLLGPARRLNLRHLFLGTCATLGIAAVLYLMLAVEHLILPDGIAPPLRQAQALMPWLAGLAPALLLIFVQSFAEELLFRGYLLQQLRARFRSILVWGIAPSALFGLLHFDAATYGLVNALAYVLNATVIGTLAAVITLRAGNIGAAAGLHFGNNAALVVFGIEGSLDGFSLFTVAMDLSGGYTTYSILTQTLVTLVAFALWWRWISRHRPIAKTAAGG